MLIGKRKKVTGKEKADRKEKVMAVDYPGEVGSATEKAGLFQRLVMWAKRRSFPDAWFVVAMLFGGWSAFFSPDNVILDGYNLILFILLLIIWFLSSILREVKAMRSERT